MGPRMREDTGWGVGRDGRFANRPYGEGKVRGAGDCCDDKIPRGTRNDMWVAGKGGGGGGTNAVS